jgi:hypothetical protein
MHFGEIELGYRAISLFDFQDVYFIFGLALPNRMAARLRTNGRQMRLERVQNRALLSLFVTSFFSFC